MQSRSLKLPRFLLCLLMGLRALFATAAEPGQSPVLPNLNANPGSEYSDSRRMFQGIPTIERAPNGRLWAAWYGGGVTEDKHNYIILDTSGDDGRTWQRALVLDPDREGPVRAFDPCLWHDPQGKLWLFWAQRRSDTQEPYTLAIQTTESRKASASWSKPAVVDDGIMMNKPLVDRNGAWLLPMAFWRTNDSARIVSSTDRGNTFKQIGAANIPKPEDRNCDEHMMVQRQNGSLWMLVRTRYGIGESISTDGGKNWPEVVPTKIQHPVTRFFIRRLSSGNLLMIRHDPPDAAKSRSHLKAFVSDNDGATWTGGLLLDERKSVSYPDAVQAPNGLIYAIYDWERKHDKEILMATFREEDVKSGKTLSSDARLRVRINKATGLNPATKSVPERSDNADGKPLLQGVGAELEFFEGEPEVFKQGAKLFLDRDYAAQEVPGVLQGCKFLRMNITGGRLVCGKSGIVYLVTPSAGRQRDSQADFLLQRGFEKASVPEFMLFEREANVCTVFQKQLTKGDSLVLPKWAVPVLPKNGGHLARASSGGVAADAASLELWDRQIPFPPFEQMRDLPCVTHIEIERAAQGGYHYLHEPAIAFHEGSLYAGWANHRLFEINVKDELLRGRVSQDGGFTWGPAKIWAAPPLLGGESFNHPVLFSHRGKLWGFFTCWNDEKPRTEIFVLSSTQSWELLGSQIPGFLPFSPPRKLDDGNWIMSGELHWFEAAVAISHGDDLTRWDVVQIPKPESIDLLYPETTLMEQDGALVAMCRPRNAKTAPAAVSKDLGRTWTPLRLSNFPLTTSKPLSGKLSNGQQYLITGNLEQRRALLSIAVTTPSGNRFCRVWKIRHQQTPQRRLLGGSDGRSRAGTNTEWSYPAAVEHEGKLYVIYTQGKEDCAMSIIPLSALETR